ncbi:group XIIB secretory phospholipase A2-like protein isoform X2 [Pseudochaenichthys georgianus]|uniref:group XIIB secretory phospholipase A2-like protein isoform X2 n=1 Tax=Pseudochaenichthys georgianus TaxID=52239 RepID=UPI00146E3881|nr:group XIIB secretory phospholipase A2-like protein isoform X2 [Pseudochaenichthys georgianus]
MLFRTVLLLTLCMSTGMSATLGFYLAQAKEEEAPTVETVTHGIVEAAPVSTAEEHVVPADPKEDDPPGDEEHVAPSDPKEDDPPAEEEHVAPPDPQADDPPANEEDVALADPKEEDPFAAEEPEANTIVGDNQVSAGEPEVVVPVAEEPETRSDDAAGDAPALEDLTEAEAVTQEQPEAEEDNDIKPVQTEQSQDEPEAAEEDNSWSFYSIRNNFQSMHGYYNSLVELVGGRDGVCQYRCKYGEIPQPRPGYQLPEPDGCSSSLVGFQLDMGIPAMTKCCDMLDMCYDTCGVSKNDCDSEFRLCVHGICSDLRKSLGFVSKVKACESMADALHSTVGTLGCRPYMNSQRAACVCEGEERDEL